MSWDLFCKALVKECAQDFVTYFAPGALYIGMRECQLQTRVDGPFDPREMRGDMAIEAARAGEPFLIDIECQSTKDEKMDERLLGYSYEMTRLHGLFVLSVVIYTQSVNNVPLAPLVRAIPGDPIPGGSPAIRFDFVSMDVCSQLVETFRQLDLDAFFVLMLLCNDGGTCAILEEVLARLQKHKRKEAISVALFFAGKVLTSEEDRKFLERKYAMLHDTLKDNWTYQKMLEEGRAEGLVQGIERGLEQGLERGLEQGHVEEARQNIERFVGKKFPTLTAWVKARIEQITDLEALREILLTVGMASTVDEVMQSLAAS